MTVNFKVDKPKIKETITGFGSVTLHALIFNYWGIEHNQESMCILCHNIYHTVHLVMIL